MLFVLGRRFCIKRVTNALSDLQKTTGIKQEQLKGINQTYYDEPEKSFGKRRQRTCCVTSGFHTNRVLETDSRVV